MSEATFDRAKMDVAHQVAEEFQPPRLYDGRRNPAFGYIMLGGVDAITEAEKIVQTYLDMEKQGEQ